MLFRHIMIVVLLLGFAIAHHLCDQGGLLFDSADMMDRDGTLKLYVDVGIRPQVCYALYDMPTDCPHNRDTAAHHEVFDELAFLADHPTGSIVE